MIRVIVVDDQIIIGVGLRNMFHPSRDGVEIGKLFRNVRDTIINAASHLFDIIILDLWIGKSCPQDNVKDLRDRFPGKSILVFTGEESVEWKRKMIQAGVNGYITKSANKTEIKRAIQGIYYNGKYFPSTIKEQPTDYLNSPDRNELSIAMLMSEGFTLKEIALKKRLSISTVENILCKLRKDYNSFNNCELVKVLFERNILS
jgi:two-component system invasion response regulator UvrY